MPCVGWLASKYTQHTSADVQPHFYLQKFFLFKYFRQTTSYTYKMVTLKHSTYRSQYKYMREVIFGWIFFFLCDLLGILIRILWVSESSRNLLNVFKWIKRNFKCQFSEYNFLFMLINCCWLVDFFFVKENIFYFR